MIPVLVVAAYLALVLYVGIFAFRKSKGTGEDYFVASRALGLTELMSPQRILRRGGNVHLVVNGHAAALHVKFAQQSSDTEQQPARVFTNDKDRWTRRSAFDA